MVFGSKQTNVVSHELKQAFIGADGNTWCKKMNQVGGLYKTKPASLMSVLSRCVRQTHGTHVTVKHWWTPSAGWKQACSLL